MIEMAKKEHGDLEKKEVLVSLKNITTGFGSNIIHENLSLDIYRGEILGLIGGSGSGKSVLLRTIEGLERPFGGSVQIMGIDMEKAGPEEVDRLRKSLGVLFQDGALFSSLNVLENIQFPLRELTKIDAKLQTGISLMKLHMVGLESDVSRLSPGELSGGMRKRVGLARALVLDPLLLLLDEPTAGLDPIGAEAFDELILSLRNNLGLTVCMVTHDLDSLHAICDRVAVLADKHIIAAGNLEEVTQNPHPWIQMYFKGTRGRAAGF